MDEGMRVIQLDIPPVPTYYTGGGRRNVVRELIQVDWWAFEWPETGTENKMLEFRFGCSLSPLALENSNAFSYQDVNYETNPDIFFVKSFTTFDGLTGASGRSFWGPLQNAGSQSLMVDGFGPIMVGNRFWSFAHLHNDVVEVVFRVTYKLWYRFIEIELDEYIGLLSTRSLTSTPL